MKIYNIGSLNIDYVYSVEHFVRPGETIATLSRSVFPGGKGLNQSVALAKAGADVVHCGMIGEDGEILLETLRECGVDTSKIKTADEPSGHAIIQVNEDGQNCIMLCAGANHRLTREYVREFLKDASRGDLVLLQNEVNSPEIIIEEAKGAGLLVAFNPSPYTKEIKNLPLSLVDIWICNEIEGGEISGESDPGLILEKMNALYPEATVVLTLGGDGAIYSSGKERVFQEIFPVQPVDTTAAGDTFTGYFLTYIAEGSSPAEAMRAAAAASSIAVSRMGASSSVPIRTEVEELLKKS